MDTIIGLLAFVFVLGVIVIVHEGGHFLFARRVNILCREFAFGMGPLIYGKKKGETLYSLRAFPIGGFCAIAGEELENDPFLGLEEVRVNIVDGVIKGFYLNDCNLEMPKMKIVKYDIFDSEETGNLYMTFLVDNEEVTYPVDPQAYLYDKKSEMQIAPYNRTLNAKRKRDRAMVIFGGPLMNFLLALIVFFLAGLMQGFPDYSSAKIEDVTSGTPVYEAGLRDGDEIVHLASGDLKMDITKWDDISLFMDQYATSTIGEVIEVTYIRNNVKNSAILNPMVNFYNTGFSNDYTLIGLLFEAGKLEDGSKILSLQAGTYFLDVTDTKEEVLPYYSYTQTEGLVLKENTDKVIVNFNKITNFFNEYIKLGLTEEIVITYKTDNVIFSSLPPTNSLKALYTSLILDTSLELTLKIISPTFSSVLFAILLLYSEIVATNNLFVVKFPSF